MRNDLDTILREITEIKQDMKLTAPLRSDIKSLQDAFISMSEALRTLRDMSVTKDQFWPVKTIVYGGAGLMLTAMLGAIVSALITRQPG